MLETFNEQGGSKERKQGGSREGFFEKINWRSCQTMKLLKEKKIQFPMEDESVTTMWSEQDKKNLQNFFWNSKLTFFFYTILDIRQCFSCDFYNFMFLNLKYFLFIILNAKKQNKNLLNSTNKQTKEVEKDKGKEK